MGNSREKTFYEKMCARGIVEHSLILTKHEDEHKHSTRNKSKLKLPRTKTNWGQKRTEFHAVNDFNSYLLNVKIQETLFFLSVMFPILARFLK